MNWITKNYRKVLEKITNKNGEASASPCKKIIDVFPEEIEKIFEKRVKKALAPNLEYEKERVDKEISDLKEELSNIENRLFIIECDTEIKERINGLSEKIGLLEEKIDSSIKESVLQRNRIEKSLKSAKIWGFIGIATAIIISIAV